MITIENRVGRLIEVRFVSPLVDSEFSAFYQERERLMRLVGSDRVVCVDLSRVQILAPSHADTFLEFLRSSRPGLARNAFLLPPGQALLALQFGRIIREANNPARRAFPSKTALVAWLGEILKAPELARLSSFLDEEPAAPR